MSFNKIFISLLFIQATAWSQFAIANSAAAGKSKCPETVKKLEKKCPAKVDPLQTGEATDGVRNMGDQLEAESGKAAMYGALVTGVCEQVVNECLKECKGEEVKQCDRFKARTNAAAAETAQAADAGAESGKTAEAAGSQGGQGTNPLGGAGMMGALSGLAGMLGKKGGDNQQQQQQQPQMPTPQATSQNQTNKATTQAVAQVDCNAEDAYSHTECNDTLVQACMNKYGESRCQNFSNRYCASATESAGSGLGSYFCKNVNAYKFCQQAGREGCPSCMQLVANKGPNCQVNPTACLLQQSPSDIAKAKQNCPTDPAFSDPNYVSGGGSILPPNLKGGGAVILPASVSSGPASDVQSQSGPSVFSVGSQTLRNRCQAGKLLNCP